MTNWSDYINKSVAVDDSPVFSSVSIRTGMVLNGNLRQSRGKIASSNFTAGSTGYSLNAEDGSIEVQHVTSNGGLYGATITGGEMSVGEHFFVTASSSGGTDVVFGVGEHTGIKTQSSSGDYSLAGVALTTAASGAGGGPFQVNKNGALTTTGITMDSVSLTTIQTGSESFVDNDTSLMTSAAIQDKIQGTTSVGTLTSLTVSGAGTFGDGSAASPSITFTNDTDTGFYSHDANEVGISVGGNEVWYVSTAGNNVWKTHTNATMYNYMLGASHAILYMGGHSSITQGGFYVTSSGYLYSRAGGAWRTRQKSNEFRPYTNNVMSCGTDAAEWTEVWAYDTSVNHSDVNAKTDIVDTTLGLDFIKSLRPRQYKWKDGGVRNHQGFIAQEVKAVLNSQGGTDASSQSMWIDTSIKSEPQLLPDHDDPETFIEVPASNYQALRYGELTAPIVKAIQELETRVTALEG
jgi:hypothetical protein